MSDKMTRDPAKDDRLILVDALDRETGLATKEEIHRRGLLHRAFSVLLTEDGPDGPRFLLSQRAPDKYHCAGLWANSCCSHPRAGETVREAALRRVREELDCGVRDPREIGAFLYRASFADGLTEYEYDHVLLAAPAGEPCPDPREIDAVRWVSAAELSDLLAREPETFCPWAFTVFSMALRECCGGRADRGVQSELRADSDQ